MTAFQVVRWVHLIAISVWVGGMITLGALVMVLRKEGVDRSVLQAAARGFAKLSWTAMGIAVLSGLGQIHFLGMPAHPAFAVKMTLVGVVCVATLAHQLTAKRTAPAVRGIVETSLLLLTLAIVAAAVVM